jgi:SAM-dependent methyltransferase
MGDPVTEHWKHLYQTAGLGQVSWYQAVPERSLELIHATGIGPTAPILDVGGGASTLVDHLLQEGFLDVSVLDLASSALTAAQARLEATAAKVQWIVADITEFQPERQYTLWHDRAVFHFLIDPERRERYLSALRRALVSGGHLILATFGPGGPAKCSGLEVQRYSAAALSAALGPGFRLVQSLLEEHVTPSGGRQQFLYGRWQRGYSP